MNSGTAASKRGAGGKSVPGIRADDEIRRLLDVLRAEEAPGTGTGEEPERAAADERLSRVVWARLAEPGDAVAGAVIAALGALPALDLLVSSREPGAFQHAFEAAGLEEPPVSIGQLSAAIDRWRPRIDRAATVGDLEQAVRAGMTILVPGDHAWPETLADLGLHVPHVLWVRGSADLLARRSLAVVGARACTGYGSHVTADLTGEACSAGFTIVSGAAYGVDAVAHRTALAAGAPTIAVLAGGADRVYPAAHARLLDRIAEHGAICSELVPGSAPTRWRFLQRNRIISALARAILVTEAGVRSGTLNTAGHGAELGRALGAVPGPITSAASTGCHRLIREYGAALITNRSELLELLGVGEAGLFPSGTHAGGAVTDCAGDGPAGGGAGASGAEGTCAGERRTPALHLRVLDALPLRGGRTQTDAARLAGVSVQEAVGVLAELEVLGFVARRESPDGMEERWVLLKRE